MIKQFYRTLTGTTTLNQSGTGSNASEGVLHIPQNSRIGASLCIPNTDNFKEIYLISQWDPNRWGTRANKGVMAMKGHFTFSRSVDSPSDTVLCYTPFCWRRRSCYSARMIQSQHILSFINRVSYLK